MRVEKRTLGWETISQALVSIAMKTKLFEVLQYFWSFSPLTKVIDTRHAMLKTGRAK